MKDFIGRTAVVTGAASGMGLAFCHRFAAEGMNIVLADIESEPLAMAEAAIRAKGAKAVALRTNVMSADAVQKLADVAFSTFGNVHILCNNAGIAAGAGGTTLRMRAWESSLEDWQWTLGVNLMGVVHGLNAFVPRMLENGDEGHIVNTSSLAGLMSSGSPYNVSKFGVECLTEGLYKDFKQMGAKLSASVLCPGLISTNILDSDRNRPPELGKSDHSGRAETQQFAQVFTAALKAGIPPEEVAETVLQAIKDDQFYIIPAQPGFMDRVKVRLDDIANMRNPTIPPDLL
jgi:NAD(P)-dependent dehydrogenase (short-subunit alcohol dehydrogenase family)